jgi:hypothetical protein
VDHQRREAIARVLFLAGMAFGSVTFVWILWTLAVGLLGDLD